MKQVGKILILYLSFLIDKNAKLVRSMNKELSLHAKYMNKTVQSNDKSMNKYYYSMVYGLSFIVTINRAFYVAIFNVLFQPLHVQISFSKHLVESSCQ